MTVGVFDSGVGGLTVVKSLLDNKLFKKIIYFGDTARVPYGVKDKNTIIRYSLEALEFFKNFKIDILITACNSVSAYAINELKENSDCEVIGVIDSGVLALQKKIKDKNTEILVIGTKATIQSNKYLYQLNTLGYKNITQKATSLFVPIVEEGIVNGNVLNTTMDYYFKDMKKPQAIILGCTHFPIIAKDINNYFNGIELIHSGDAIVEYLKNHCQIDRNFEKTEIELFASENPDNLKKIATKWLDINFI